MQIGMPALLCAGLLVMDLLLLYVSLAFLSSPVSK